MMQGETGARRTPWRGSAAAVLLLYAAMSARAAPNLVGNGDMKEFWMCDDTYDGVNQNGEIKVFTYGEEVMCEGYAPSGRSFGASPVWADLDNDKKPELVVGDAYGFIWTFKPRSRPKEFPPTFTTGVWIRSYFGNALNIDVFDFDQDGQKDLMVGTADGAIQFVRNLGDGVFVKEDYKPNYCHINTHALGRKTRVDTAQMFPLVMKGQYPLFVGLYAAPRFVDWNRDGAADLILGEGGYSANSIYLFLNKGQTSTPDFNESPREWLVYGNGRENLSPAVGDLDGDGDLDLLVGERLGYLTWFENKPAATASDTPFLLEPSDKVPLGHMTVGGQEIPAGELPRPHLADLDGDGMLDLLIGKNDGRIIASRNIGTAKLPVFDTPVILKGIDTAKPRKCPTGWWGGFGGGGASDGHSAFMCIQDSEPNLETGSTTYFARLCYNYSYMGLGGGIGAGGSVEYEREYVVSFKARARDAGGLTLDIRQGRESSVDRKAQTIGSVGNDVTTEFDPGDQWRSFRQRFRWKHLTEESKDRKTTGFGLGFSMKDPRAVGYVDITEVVVEETHPEKKEEEPTPKPAPEPKKEKKKKK